MDAKAKKITDEETPPAAATRKPTKEPEVMPRTTAIIMVRIPITTRTFAIQTTFPSFCRNEIG
jgi:hypothetical protein